MLTGNSKTTVGYKKDLTVVKKIPWEIKDMITVDRSKNVLYLLLYK